jgi:predicted transcriptional regulator of viral defense system
VRRGAYVVRPRSRALAITALELVGALERDGHLVTAGAALAFHRLSDQSFRTIIVLTPAQQRGWVWQGERVVYVQTRRDRIWGERVMRPAAWPTWIARPERAILDALAHPKWGVSLSQVVEAVGNGLRETRQSDTRFSERLAQAAARYGNAAVSRRLGFIVSELAGDAAAAPLRGLIGTSRTMTLLDPSGRAQGPTHTDWRLRENVPFDLLSSTQHG